MIDERFEKLLICILMGVALWAVIALSVLMVMVIREAW
jgi:hypothetical protein